MKLRDERRPVLCCMDLAELDDAEMMEGFVDAYEGLQCGDNRSRSYWHGWRSGALDKHMRERDKFDDILFADYFKGGAREGERRVAEIRKALAAATLSALAQEDAPPHD